MSPLVTSSAPMHDDINMTICIWYWKDTTTEMHRPITIRRIGSQKSAHAY